MFGLKCWLEGLNGDVFAFMRYECDWWRRKFMV